MMKKCAEKASSLISAYIELAQQNFYDDAQIIDDLSGIFTRKDLEELGYGDFSRTTSTTARDEHEEQDHPLSTVCSPTWRATVRSGWTGGAGGPIRSSQGEAPWLPPAAPDPQPIHRGLRLQH